MHTKQEHVRELEMHILRNEMLPPELRCDEAIALMKAMLARWKRPDLILVSKRDA